MMEHLFVEHPEECLAFFKRNMKISMVTGGSLILSHIIALEESWKSWEAKNIWDKLLWFWVATRVITYFSQIPVRYRIVQRVWQADRQTTLVGKRQHLLDMLRMWEWTVVQYVSRGLLTWLLVTIWLIWWFADVFEDQVHRTSVFRYCWTSVILLGVQTAISVRWLKRVLNDGWVDDKEITVDQFRNSTDQFRSLTELKHLLCIRLHPFDRLPLTVNPKTLVEDPMTNVQIYFPTHCAICKFGFSLSSHSSPLSIHDSEPEHNDPSVTDARNDEIPPPAAEPVTLLPCGHIFHVECIESWITLSHSKCPYCSVSTLSDRVWVTAKEGLS